MALAGAHSHLPTQLVPTDSHSQLKKRMPRDNSTMPCSQPCVKLSPLQRPSTLPSRWGTEAPFNHVLAISDSRV
jgi:hypothetical protein